MFGRVLTLIGTGYNMKQNTNFISILEDFYLRNTAALDCDRESLPFGYG